MITISDNWAPLLVSAIRDAVLYQEGLLRNETLSNRSDHEENLVQLSQFLEYVKEEYKKVESSAGIPIDKLLPHSGA